MQKEETTLDDVLDAVNKGFSEMQVQFEGNKADVTGLKADVGGLKADVADLKQRVTKIEAVMVTKDYLDEKLYPIYGKIDVLADVLHENETISNEQRQLVRSRPASIGS